ncbi:MAG TPA: hypothetical protein VMX35_00525 [Acidobacteriota bacterium]|nr:hypothetical protein [Acidobacteriota bacterium]
MSDFFKKIEEAEGLLNLIAFSREDGALAYCSGGLNPDFSSEIAFRIRSEIEAAPAAVHRIVISLGEERVIVIPSGEHFLALYVSQAFSINSLRDHLREEPAPKRLSMDESKIDRHVGIEDMELLVAGLTTICRPALDELGVFVVVNALRKTRDALMRSHRCLSAFSVEKGGTISHGEPPNCKLSEIVTAAAEWAMDFYNHCNSIVPTFPPSLAVSLLDQSHDNLDKIGFFNAFDVATR